MRYVLHRRTFPGLPRPSSCALHAEGTPPFSAHAIHTFRRYLLGPFFVAQADSDQDGYGDICDTCPDSHLVDVPVLDPNALFPADEPFTDYACCTTDADCAPLICGKGSPENPVPPAGPLCFPGDSRGTIVEQLLASGVAVELCASHCAAPKDFDCDGTGELCDLCPEKFNPAQTDTDGDGVGDACDNCPGGDTPHPEDLNPPCNYFNDALPLGDDYCSSLHPDSVCLPPHPDVARCSLFADDDSDGVGQSCDNCKDTSNPADDFSFPGLPQPKQRNCNRITEDVLGVPYPFVGDACDRNPCSNFEAYKAFQSETHYDAMGWVAEVDYAPRLLPFWALSEGSPPFHGPPFSYTCPPKETPPSTGHCDEPKATSGLRFCSCNLLGIDGKPDPVLCQAVCPVDSNEYFLGISNWKTPSLLMSGNIIYDPPSTAPYLSGAEVADQQMINPVPDSTSEYGLLAESTPSSSTSFWYTAPDIAAFGGGNSQLTGVVWSHVAWVTLLFPTEAQAESEYRPTSNHYRGGVFGPPPPTNMIIEAPEMIPLPKWFPLCDPLIWWPETPDEGTFVVDASATLVGLRTLAGDVDLTPTASVSAITALGQSSVQWVGASEPGVQPDGAAGLASVTSDGLGVTAVLGTQGGQVVTLVGPESPPSPPTNARTRFGTALSSTEASVFVVGGQDVATQQYPGDVWRYDVTSRAWTQLQVTGARPELVLTATFRAQDGALYVADRVGGVAPQSRLLRIDLSTHNSTVLGHWTPTLTWDRTHLSNTHDGRLLLVASSSVTDQFTVVAFDPTADLSQASGPSFLSYSNRGTVAVAPTLTRKGLTLPVASATSGVQNQFVRLTDLMALPGANDNLIEQCL